MFIIETWYNTRARIRGIMLGAPKPTKKTPKKASPQRIERWAVAYIERYAGSSGQLRRVLGRRAARADAFHDMDPQISRAAIEAVLEKLVAAGFLDDAAYGKARARRLMARGAAPRAITADLKRKGLTREHIEAALAGLKEETADPEETAARAYCRRRRIGPFQEGPPNADDDRRALAALGRRGFSYEVARRVLADPLPPPDPN